MIRFAPSASPNAGFTLMELLVALALMATIGTTMAVAVAQLRPMRAFEQRIDDQRIVDTLAEVIARDIQPALRLPLLDERGSSSMLLEGQRQKVVFTAVVPTGYRRWGLREVTYELVGSQEDTRLRRITRLRRFSQEQNAELRIDDLFIGASDLRLSYLVSNEHGKQDWQDDFREMNRLPRAVSITVDLAGARRGRATRIVPLGRIETEP